MASNNDKDAMNNTVTQLLSFGNTLKDDEKINNSDNHIHELAYKAAQEFQKLTAEKNELFREKEQFKQKHDDLIEKMQDLQHVLTDSEIYKEQNQTLLSQNANYETEIRIFEQEKSILQETIQDLKQHIDINTEPMQMEIENSNSSVTQQKTVKHDNGSYGTDDGQHRFMVEISRMTKEKNEFIEQLEAYKFALNNKNKAMCILNQRFVDSGNEVKRLSNNLTQQQNKYIKLEKSKNEQKHIYDRNISLHSDQIVDEHKAKEMKFMQTIENLNKKIQELQQQNAQLQNDKNKSEKKRHHMRIRTANDVLGAADLYDMEPFDDEDEEELSEDDDDNDNAAVIETFHNDIDVKTPHQSIDQHGDNNKDKKTVSNQCACFVSFFNRFKKNNTKNVQNEYQMME